ncbi:MAG: hypothetical protein RIC35_17430 [Marinoscillum sp.]
MKILKSILLSGILMSLLSYCEFTKEKELVYPEDVQLRTGVVSVKDDEKVRRLVNDLFSSLPGGRINVSEIDSAAYVIDEETGATNYAMLASGDDYRRVENIVLKQIDTAYLAYKIIYEPSEDHLKFMNPMHMLAGFSGTVTYESLETGEVFIQYEMLNGAVVRPAEDSNGRVSNDYGCYPDQQHTESSECYGSYLIGGGTESGKVNVQYKTYRDGNGNKRTRISGFASEDGDEITILLTEVNCHFDLDFSECYYNEFNTLGFTVVPQYSQGGASYVSFYNNNYTPTYPPSNLADALQDLVDEETDPEERREKQLNYIEHFGGLEGKEFRSIIDDLLETPNLTYGEVLDINEAVDRYYLNLLGQYIIAIYGPVAEIAKPFIELALFETGAGVLFQAVKGIISVRWGVQLAKIGVNTASISTVTNRLVNGIIFGARNTSLTLKIGGRNLVSSSVSGSKSTYKFSNSSKAEAEAIFNDMVAGREIKTITTSNGIIKRVSLGNNDFIQMRRFSEANLGETTIEFKLNSVRDAYKIELKFLH